MCEHESRMLEFEPVPGLDAVVRHQVCVWCGEHLNCSVELPAATLGALVIALLLENDFGSAPAVLVDIVSCN